MIIYRRGKNVALAGTILQVVLSFVMLAVWLYTDSESAMAAMWFFAAGTAMWLMATVMLYCRQLARREALELTELTAAGAASGTIFQSPSELELRPAAARVKFMDRWIAPSFTLVLAALQILTAAATIKYLYPRHSDLPEENLTGGLFCFLVMVVSFLFSRYAVGMSERPEWRLLRATGSYLTMNVLAAAATMIVLLLRLATADLVVAWVIAFVQALLAVELILNFVLDLYRPRVAGQEDRYSFDSRLFNLVAQPGKVGHSLAEAINYQFGFEVSKSWFYQLLGRAFVPLIGFALLALMAMSSIVIVEEGQQYVVLHWGQLGSPPRTLNPGVHFKCPWPIDTARCFNVGKLHEIVLGVERVRTQEEREAAYVKGKELLLWKEEHGPMVERDFLIAAPPRQADTAPPVDMIKLVIRVQFVITDIARYGFAFVDPDKTLEVLASREMVNYCASATLDQPIAGTAVNRPEAIMTFGRQNAAEEFKNRIQAVAEQVNLGIKVTYVGLQAVHPPAKLAPEFEKVLEAERRQEVVRLAAEADASKVLTDVAGDPTTARELALAIRIQGDLESLRDCESNPAAMAVKLDSTMAWTAGEIDRLTKEIERERLLGRIQLVASPAAGPTEQKSWRHKLLGLHQGYLDLLTRIKDARASKSPGELKALLIEQLAVASSDADALLDRSLGKPAVKVAQERTGRWAKELSERAKSEVFQNYLLAYRASPSSFVLDRWLDMWDDVLPNAVKYFLAADRSKLLLRLNWETSSTSISGIDFKGPSGDSGSSGSSTSDK